MKNLIKSRMYQKFLIIGLVIGSAGAFLLSGCEAEQEWDYVVWTADQNANDVYILSPDGEVLEIIDRETIGNAERPHMLWGIPPDPYIYSANSVSGTITVLDSRDNSVAAVIENVGKLPHAAQPVPNRPDHIYVSNIGPQDIDEEGNPDLGETIAEIIRSDGDDGPVWELTRFLDLKADPALADDDMFPSRRPVCAGFTPEGDAMLVTLFNGGLAVVDLDEWSVRQAWGRDEIAEHGCGFAESPDRQELYVTAGGMHSSWMYVFDFSGDEPELVVSHNLSDSGQDAHGVWVDTDREELWVIHRVSDNATIHPLNTIRNEGHDYEIMDFVGRTPDLITMPEDNSKAFVTLRGPNPAPTIPHDIVGERPGISIIDVASRELLDVIYLGDPEMGDMHGIFIPRGN
jgi:YVTN family beta-propeller protein